jgi:hypothetical protein
MSDLDTLIERARSAAVHRADAERYVREIERRAQDSARPRRWVPWLAAGLAAAAAVAALLLWGKGRDRGPGQPGEAIALRALSNRVTIVAEPDTVYRVERAGSESTKVVVERGTVTARLWHGAPHRLELSGGDVTAIATGTVYSLAVQSGGAVVSVLEGTVEVRRDKEVHAVHASQTWPPGRAAADPAAGRALLALSVPPPVPPANENRIAGESRLSSIALDAGVALDADVVLDAGSPGDADAVLVDAGEQPGDAAEPDAGGAVRHIAHLATASRAPGETPPIKDRWRTARLLRGQGKFARAVAECLAITDAADPTWSPIALIEAIRIELGPLADPERAIALADRMIRDWSADALVSEARELRCRALRQLGRAAECAPPPQP